MTRLYDNLRRIYEDFPIVPVLSVDNVAEYIYDKYEPYKESWKDAPTLAPMLNPVFIETLKPRNSPDVLPQKWGALICWTDRDLKSHFMNTMRGLGGVGARADFLNLYWDGIFKEAHWLLEYRLSFMVDGRIHLDDVGAICALDERGKYLSNSHLSVMRGHGWFWNKQDEHIYNRTGKTSDEILNEDKPTILDAVSHPSKGDVIDAYLHPMMTALLMGLTLAHCKNVELIDQTPPPKLSKRAECHHGKPLISYYVLKVNPLKTVVHVTSDEEIPKKKGITHPKPLSIFRGHFKDFRDGKGLFGKHKEIYWWDQHVRGNEENGVVIKDYSVTKPVGESA